MPDLGIGEALAAFGGADFLGGLFGGAEAAGAAGATEAGIASGVGALEGTGAALGGAEAGLGAGALGAGGADAFAAGGLGDLAAAGGGGFGDFLGGAADVGGGFGAPGDLAITPGALTAPSGGAGGLGASGFAPASGVEFAGGIAPDATSAAAFNPSTIADSFATRAGAASDAISGGLFDPQGANATNFSGAGAPAGSPPPGINSPLPVQSVPTESFTQAAGGAPGAAPGGTAGLDSQVLGAQAAAPAPTSLAPPGGAPGAAPGASGGGFFDKLGSSVMKNPVGLGLGAVGLGYNVLAGQKQSAATQALADAAAKRGSTADTLSGYLTSGTLPPGLQGSVDQATQSAKATAISNAAQQGLPTDPSQNTALAQRLAQIDAQGPIVAAQIAQQLLQSGATYAGLSDQLYTQLAQIDQTQTANIGKAIANMASALNTGGTRIQIGGTAA